MSGWDDLANSRKSSFVILFVQHDLLPRPGIFAGRAGQPGRAGGAVPAAKPGLPLEAPSSRMEIGDVRRSTACLTSREGIQEQRACRLADEATPSKAASEANRNTLS